MRRNIIVAILLAAFLLSAATTFAADPRRDEAMKRIEMLRIWRLTEILDLNAEDAARVFPLLQRYDVMFQEKHRNKDMLLQQTQKELDKPKPDKNLLNDLTSRIIKIEQESMNIHVQMYKELKEVFTPDQLARYMIFELKFKKEIDDIINQVRRERLQMGKERRRFQKLRKNDDEPTPNPE